jgi:ketosteroid isomerase-like protein
VPGDPAANAVLIHRFYEAFARRDHETMAACYQPDATFSDPVFQDLEGEEVTSMWRMLCERGTDLEIVHSDVRADEDHGFAHWDADYTFTATGRRVHNSIDASFVFHGGLIAAHVDRFSLWAWTRQALGPVGAVLGWSPPVQHRVRAQANENLRAFMRGEPATGE